MSDDLVKRLTIKAGVMEMGEKIAWGSDTSLMREAADRIEELDKACKEWAEVSQSNYQRAKAAEAKLDKAVGQMQRVKDYRYDPNIGIELNRLEEALAELKGETDE